MYIPNTAPQNLEEMMAFLQPAEGDLFDDIIYDDESSPTKIICKQNGVGIFETYMSGRAWYFMPYIGSEGSVSSNDNHYGYMNLAFAARCKGGVMFRSNDQGSPSYYINFIIGKTNTGKTGFIKFTGVNKYYHTAPTYYTTCFDDNTSTYLYQYGYIVGINYQASTADRTILTTIPVNGEIGTTDYFETVKIRTLVQFVETGVQIIDGKKYGCIDTIAILDEDLPTSNSTPNSDPEPEPESEPGE